MEIKFYRFSIQMLFLFHFYCWWRLLFSIIPLSLFLFSSKRICRMGRESLNYTLFNFNQQIGSWNIPLFVSFLLTNDFAADMTKAFHQERNYCYMLRIGWLCSIHYTCIQCQGWRNDKVSDVNDEKTQREVVCIGGKYNYVNKKDQEMYTRTEHKSSLKSERQRKQPRWDEVCFPL